MLKNYYILSRSEEQMSQLSETRLQHVKLRKTDVHKIFADIFFKLKHFTKKG